MDKSNRDSLKEKLQEFLNKINMYNGVYDFIDNKTPEEVKEYWDIVELCRDIKKRMESIYEKP
jgi:predicted RNA-binding protein (virulence factor B family)